MRKPIKKQTNSSSSKENILPEIILEKLPKATKQQIQQQFNAPAEIAALISGKIPNEHIPLVLEIFRERITQPESERNRQYKAFVLSEW